MLRIRAVVFIRAHMDFWYSGNWIVSATSYYRFCDSTPFDIARGSYSQQHNVNSYSHMRKYRRNRSGNIRRGARGNPWIHSTFLCEP